MNRKPKKTVKSHWTQRTNSEVEDTRANENVSVHSCESSSTSTSTLEDTTVPVNNIDLQQAFLETNTCDNLFD